MSRQGWSECLIASEVDSTAVTGTAVGSLLPPAALFTLPANFFDIGKTLRIRATGRVSNIITTPGTLTLAVKLGAVIAFSGGAMQLNAVAKTNVTWTLDALLTCRTIGATTVATVLGTGAWLSESVVGSAVPGTGGSGTLLMPASVPAVGTGFDSTAALAVDLTAIFSLTGNSIQSHQYQLFADN